MTGSVKAENPNEARSLARLEWLEVWGKEKGAVGEAYTWLSCKVEPEREEQIV